MELFENNNPNLPFKKIRVIPYKLYQGELNMAVDYYFSKHVSSGNEPVLRFYGWQPYCLSLGKHQDEKLINWEEIYKDGYEVVRRSTGGSAIFHSEELTYSIVVPKNIMHHKELYLLMHQIIYKTMLKMGYNVNLQTQKDSGNYLKTGNATLICFNRSAYTEIQYDNKKLVGSAQKIFSDSILQHGSILVGPSQNRIVNYFMQDNDQKNKNFEHLLNNSTYLNKLCRKKTSALELSEVIISEINHSTDVYYEQLNDSELNDAKKYCSDFKLKNIN